MQRPIKIWTSVVLLGMLTCSPLRAESKYATHIITQIRQELWDNGLWEDGEELEAEEKEILLGEQHSNHARPEELERALEKVTFLASVHGP
jgi:hypothetical protein